MPDYRDRPRPVVLDIPYDTAWWLADRLDLWRHERHGARLLAKTLTALGTPGLYWGRAHPRWYYSLVVSGEIRCRIPMLPDQVEWLAESLIRAAYGIIASLERIRPPGERNLTRWQTDHYRMVQIAQGLRRGCVRGGRMRRR